jgi:hypothetical protein
MRKVIMAFGIAALVAALGGVGYAQTTKSAKVAKTSAPAAKAASATGKIVSFDDASKTLTISTSKGEEKFVLGSTVKLNEGAKTITSANLSSLTGQQAKIRYTVSGSDKTAESVMVSEPAHAAKKK